MNQFRQIPFFVPDIGQEEIDEVVECLRSGWLTTGPRTKLFEAEFARYAAKKHAIAVNSCTAALHLALEAIGIRSGDYVIVPTMTFAATAEVVRYFDAVPLLVDCRPDDFGLDVDDARRRIRALRDRQPNARIRAVLPVHYGGLVADMAGTLELARAEDLAVVDDAAHCCPAFYRHESQDAWRFVGAESSVCCFSFYANKTITTGEGGMICTDNDELASRMQMMSLHGISHNAWKRFTAQGSWSYDISAPGFKYNLTDIASAIGLHQLRKSDRMHERRSALARLYQQQLGDVAELLLPSTTANRIHSWHLFPIRLQLDRIAIDRGRVIEILKERGIITSVHWKPLHMHPYYEVKYGYRAQNLPVAASIFPELISLPLFPRMSDDDVVYVCNALKSVLAANQKCLRA